MLNIEVVGSESSLLAIIYTPPPPGSAGVEDGPVSLPHLRMDTLSGVLLTNHQKHPLSRI